MQLTPCFRTLKTNWKYYIQSKLSSYQEVAQLCIFIQMVFKDMTPKDPSGPFMVDNSNGFITKCRGDQAFSAKMLKGKEIMNVATKITCFIQARSL